MISETLGNIYTGIENKFYSVFDFLEEKGLPVYSVIDPIEGKGIPFFPLTIALIAILVIAVFGFGVIGTGFEAGITVNLKDGYQKGLSGVTVKVFDATGKELLSETKNNGDEIKINVQAGTELTFKAEKTGYESSETTIKIINKNEEVNLSLKKILNTIKAQLKFYDEETETAITGVYASIEWQGIVKDGTSNEQGIIEFLDIPLEEDLYITAFSDSYYEYTGSLRFESEETKSIFLSPKELSFEGLKDLYKNVAEVNQGILDRIREVEKTTDASQNAVVILNTFIQMFEFHYSLDLGPVKNYFA